MSIWNFEPIAWNNYRKEIPDRPTAPAAYAEDDNRHWYDMEFAGWGVRKENLPETPFDGPEKKRVFCLLPGTHPYFETYSKSMSELADLNNMLLTVLYADWDVELQSRQIDYAIESHPDMIILSPFNSQESTKWYKKINEAGIPVIASNFIPEDEGFKYIVAWTGADDWGQFRMLARKLAELMNYEGGYCILRHMPGTSSYYARTYAVITELKKIAPNMKLLKMDTAGLDIHKTKQIVVQWIKTFGKELKGIVSADDAGYLQGILNAVELEGRKDIIRVAAGMTQNGLDFLKSGAVHAITYQQPEIDGTMPIQLAIDWFNGLVVEPIRYLPARIITQENLHEFSGKSKEKINIDVKKLDNAIREKNSEYVNMFFYDVYQEFLSNRTVTKDYFYGFCMEVTTNLVHIMRELGLEIHGITEGYENLYKNLFMQKNLKNTLDWMKKLSLKIVARTSESQHDQRHAVTDIIEEIRQNYNKPISLKTLSYGHNLSPGYLGQLIKKETGKMFNQYLNELRIQKAQSLIKHTTLSLRDIAFEVGFENPDYFYYVFKKYTGVFPAEFIQIKSNNIEKNLL